MPRNTVKNWHKKNQKPQAVAAAVVANNIEQPNRLDERTRSKEGLWQKIKKNRLLLMVLCCVVPIVLVIGLLALFGKVGNYWIWLVILLCPILHFWMMKEHKHDGNHKHDERDS